MTWSSPVRSASLISPYGSSTSSSSSSGSPEYSGESRVELLDLLGLLVGLFDLVLVIVANRGALDVRSDAHDPWPWVGNETFPKFAGWVNTSRIITTTSPPGSWIVVIAAS